MLLKSQKKMLIQAIAAYGFFMGTLLVLLI